MGAQRLKARHLLFAATVTGAAVAAVAGIRLLVALTVSVPEGPPWEGGTPFTLREAPPEADGVLVSFQGQVVGRVFLQERVVRMKKGLVLPVDSVLELHHVGDGHPAITVLPGRSQEQLRPWEHVSLRRRDPE